MASVPLKRFLPGGTIWNGQLTKIKIPPMNPTRIVAIYFFTQAGAVVAWWGLLLTHPESIHWFQPACWPAVSLLSYWLADFTLIVVGSIVVGVAVVQRVAWATTGVWTVATVTWYPTLVCLATSVRTDEAWIASMMMLSMAGLSLAMATIHGTPSQSPAAIRSATMSRRASVSWTLAQTFIFWGTFLWVLPMGIVELQQLMGWVAFQHSFQRLLSLALFLAASALGLSSGITMATRGRGTPLPTATAPRLVVAGPYRFVRNPMAVAGILQGIAVGWYLGSVPVIAYSLVGAVLWHIAVRPVEERDLANRFGDRYEAYRATVGLWIPKLHSKAVSK